MEKLNGFGSTSSDAEQVRGIINADAGIRDIFGEVRISRIVSGSHYGTDLTPYKYVVGPIFEPLKQPTPITERSVRDYY